MGSIVHVDNSDFFRKLMRTFLVELGHESEGYSRGEDALDVAMSGKVDFVITGLELADMSGEDFIKQLIVSTQVPIIVVTSNENDSQRNHLESLGVKAVVLKSGNWKDQLGEQLVNIN